MSFFLICQLVDLAGYAQSQFVVNTDAQLRAGPGTRYKQLCVIKAGEKIVQKDSVNSQWLEVNYQQHVGFVARKLLTLVVDTVALAPAPVAIKKIDEQPGFSYPLGILIILSVLLISYLLMASKRRLQQKSRDNAEIVRDAQASIVVVSTSNTITQPPKTICPVQNTPGNNAPAIKTQPTISSTNKAVQNQPPYSKPNVPNIKSKVPVLLASEVTADFSLNKWTEEQKQFFQHFKETFLQRSYLDIEGNQNYVLFLLDSLIKDFTTHQNKILLKAQLRQIDLWFPFMKKFTAAALEKAVPIGDTTFEIPGSKHKEPEVSTATTANIAPDSLETNSPANTLSEDLKAKISSVIKELERPAQVTQDRSVIDVNNQQFQTSIPSSPKPAIVSSIVPHWQHSYIYAYNELLKATPSQQTYYAEFKDKFLKSQFCDLQGNSNYAFILLFDFLQEYDKNKNLLLLKSNLSQLGEHYPVTRRYAMNFLAEKIRKTVSPDEVIIAGTVPVGVNTVNNNGYYFEASYWGIGTRYKTKLNLKEEEVILLNKIGSVNNNFTDIEWCCRETIKLFLAVVVELQETYKSSGSFDKELNSLASLVATKHYRYKINGNNFNYSIDPIKNEIFVTIFKFSENAVREKFNHKRKLNTDWIYSPKEVKETLETKINVPVSSILRALENNILLPDEETDTKLYAQNTARWKVKFEDLTNSYDGNGQKFIEKVIALGDLNKNNPSVENIFYEASKFIAKTEKEAAIKLYVYYLHYDLISEKFDNKQIAKSLHKSLFKTEDQLHSFEKLITELIKDKNLEKALSGVSEIYRVKRKKIKLDTSIIKEVEEHHAGTVELLNEYLSDEAGNPEVSLQTVGVNADELTVTIETTDKVKDSPYIKDLVFTAEQMDLLDLFARHNLMLPVEEMESFARSKNIFAKPMIESINETCFEKLDDILIEEEKIEFVINPDYYQIILLK